MEVDDYDVCGRCMAYNTKDKHCTFQMIKPENWDGTCRYFTPYPSGMSENKCLQCLSYADGNCIYLIRGYVALVKCRYYTPADTACRYFMHGEKSYVFPPDTTPRRECYKCGFYDVNEQHCRIHCESRN